MKLEFDVYDALCEMRVFEINDIVADYEDFGEKFDRSPESAADYSCGNMCFTGKLATQEVLDKYKINITEYNEIVEKLEEGLSFGCCGWCS